MALITLSRFLIEEERHKQFICADLRFLVEIVSRACKAISIAIGKGNLAGVLGGAGTDNVQGEAQKKLDVISNEILLEANEWGGHLAAMTSEEMEDPHLIPHRYPKGEYLLVFDPLDGSSNIDVNISVGTIFSVLRCPEGVPVDSDNVFLQPGTREFGHFVLTQEHIRIPEDTREFAINMSNSRFWEAPVKRYIDELLAGKDGPRGKDFNMRWVASMVADVFRILTRGGVFLYPLDSKMKDKGGKLRLMYEANPMAMIVEQAGGVATTGRQRILDIQPTSLHQRVPVILGSRNEVERVAGYHRD